MIEYMMSKKDIILLEKILTNYTHFEISQGNVEGYRLWAWTKDKFPFRYYFTNGFLSENECEKHVKNLLKEYRNKFENK